MLLDNRKPADPLVVGEGLVVRRHEAGDLQLALLAQNFQAQVAIKEQVLCRHNGVSRHRRGSAQYVPSNHCLNSVNGTGRSTPPWSHRPECCAEAGLQRYR